MPGGGDQTFEGIVVAVAVVVAAKTVDQIKVWRQNRPRKPKTPDAGALQVLADWRIEVRKDLDECREHHEECRAENRGLREQNQALSSRVKALEDWQHGIEGA